MTAIDSQKVALHGEMLNGAIWPVPSESSCALLELGYHAIANWSGCLWESQDQDYNMQWR